MFSFSPDKEPNLQKRKNKKPAFAGFYFGSKMLIIFVYGKCLDLPTNFELTKEN